MKMKNTTQFSQSVANSKPSSIERESDEWDYEVKERQTAKMEELAELGTYVLSNITEFDAYISNGRLHAGREPI